MKFLSILIMAVAVCAISCERHEFEGPDGTRQLHEKHGAHAADHDEHPESSEHGEKPAAH
jgi:hypothetical protein